MNVSDQIEMNINTLKESFQNCSDVVERRIPVGSDQKQEVYLSYLDMLTNRDLIEENIISKLIVVLKTTTLTGTHEQILNTIIDCGLSVADLKTTENMDEVILAMLSGDTVLFVTGCEKAIVISTRGFPNRGIPQTETEVVVQGSKEAFSEVFRFNTMLIRRRIRDHKLKVKPFKLGRRSSTDVALMYLEDVVRPSILKETEKRLNKIDIDAILDCGMVEQFIEDDWLSPFPQVQTTERPDKAASAILEGRIVIVVDNTPFVLIVPATMNVFFQTSEDYYQRFEIMSFVRFIRFIAAFIAICAPGLYLATAAFHPSMIPMLLVFKMAGARQNVPFPGIIEILIMEFAFEMLREAGIRLPGAVGASIGIVGGIIIGQAAVDAGIVSPIVVIIVALTGMAGFTVPQYSFVSGFRLMKYFVTLASAFLGFFGFWAANIVILIHMVSLKSFGIPYMYPYASGDINDNGDLKDTIFRFPIFAMSRRPIFANPGQQIRMRWYRKRNQTE